MPLSPLSVCPSPRLSLPLFLLSLPSIHQYIHGERSMQKTMMKRLGSIGACSAGWLAGSSISIRWHDVATAARARRLLRDPRTTSAGKKCRSEVRLRKEGRRKAAGSSERANAAVLQPPRGRAGSPCFLTFPQRHSFRLLLRHSCRLESGCQCPRKGPITR